MEQARILAIVGEEINEHLQRLDQGRMELGDEGPERG
jgi:hypothetical protein